MGDVMMTSGKIAKGAYVNEWRAVADSDKLVHKASIIGTSIVVYEVWEPYVNGRIDGRYFSTHSTITYQDGVALGDMTTRDIPPEMDALPSGDERVRAVRAWYDANKAEARAVVLSVYGADF